MAKKKKVVVEEKLYTIKYTKYHDGSSEVERKNDGFNPFELIGYMEQVQIEILQQLKGVITPNTTKLIAKVDKKVTKKVTK
jgi:hypothetical protein